jgi:hypothetical protein
MRYSNIWTGLGAVLVILSASVAQAGQRDATAKILGNMQGNNAQPAAAYRAFSYAPAEPAAAAAAATEAAQPCATASGNSARSYSYEPGTSSARQPAYGQGSRGPGYLRADRKVQGEY